MTLDKPPERTLEQRLQALDKANKVRVRRSKFKRELKAGRVVVYEYIIDPPAWMETMKLLDLILSLPKYGRVRSNKVLVKVSLSPSKTVGGLSLRQRHELVTFLRNF